MLSIDDVNQLSKTIPIQKLLCKLLFLQASVFEAI